MSLIRLCPLDTSHSNNLVALYMKLELTTNTAIRTCCSDGARFPPARFAHPLLFYEGSHGAELNTFTALDATGFPHGYVIVADYFCMTAPEAEIEHFVDDHVIAARNASAAMNAFVGIAHDKGGGFVAFLSLFHNARGYFYAKTVSGILQFAVAVHFAGYAVMISIGKQQVNSHFSSFDYTRCLRVYPHSIIRDEGAGGLQSSHPIYFDHTYAAFACGPQPGMVTQRWNIYPIFTRGLQNSGFISADDLSVIDKNLLAH
jgi:hypothetical protein